MTKPDPDVPDPETPDPDPADARSPDREGSGAQSAGSDAAADGATDDDAVWLDLVARLEGIGDGTDEAAPGWPDEHGPAGGETGSTGTDRAGGTASTARAFRDFDPLGLAGAAPKELSAAFAASVVFLIMKLPGEKDENDDGARV